TRRSPGVDLTMIRREGPGCTVGNFQPLAVGKMERVALRGGGFPLGLNWGVLSRPTIPEAWIGLRVHHPSSAGRDLKVRILGFQVIARSEGNGDNEPG